MPNSAADSCSRSGGHYLAVKNVTILAKCLTSSLWENSKFVSKQFERVGQVFSASLVHAGMTSFQVRTQSVNLKSYHSMRPWLFYFTEFKAFALLNVNRQIVACMLLVVNGRNVLLNFKRIFSCQFSLL